LLLQGCVVAYQDVDVILKDPDLFAYGILPGVEAAIFHAVPDVGDRSAEGFGGLLSGYQGAEKGRRGLPEQLPVPFCAAHFVAK